MKLNKGDIYDNEGQSDSNFLELSVFIREMLMCFRNLKDAILCKDIQKARAFLHQMLGATQIMKIESLEKDLIMLQVIVKSDESLIGSEIGLKKIQNHLNEVFEYLLLNRKEYNLYLLFSEESNLLKIKEWLRKLDFIHFEFGLTLEAFEMYLSQFEPDVVLTDYSMDSEEIKKLIDLLETTFVNSPVILMDLINEPTSQLLLDDNNLADSFLSNGKVESLVECIKIVANGRQNWQQLVG